ncbi:MAG TPA: ATP-binding cassette domain-containing protein [Candidatus Binatia bacterium]
MNGFVEFDRTVFALPDGRHILDDFSLSVPAGQTLALIGRSGSGKTTALRLVNALLLPTSGSVRVGGVATTDQDPIALRRRCGYVIQEVGLFPHLDVARNVATVPELEGWSPARIRERTHELLAMVGLEPDTYAGRFPHQLSGGQRQRVGVARALAADPPLLLLDEPFAALDPITRRELQQEFRELSVRLGKTAVFVTHDLAEAARVADRVALVVEGRLVADGSVADLAASTHDEARAFIAASEWGVRSAGAGTDADAGRAATP